MKLQVTCLRDHPELMEKAACWFAEKWSIPMEAYRQSMQECIEHKTGIPQWYLVRDDKGNITAGAGVIENDFHDRKDLTPNLCALFVEEKNRRQGIARSILDFARKDCVVTGLNKLYLITDHTEFYEKCGWNFLTLVRSDEGSFERMYVASTL